MRFFLVVLLISTCLFPQNKSSSGKTEPSPQPSGASSKTASGKDSPALAVSKATGWQVQERKATDGTREVALVRDSENEVGGNASSHPAHLAIRCSKHKPDVFINVGGPFETISGKTDIVDVRIKFDGSTGQKQRWLSAADRESAFASSPIPLLKRMAASSTFQFTFTGSQKREATVTFKMGDLKQKLEPLSDVCGL